MKISTQIMDKYPEYVKRRMRFQLFCLNALDIDLGDISEKPCDSIFIWWA